MAVAIWHFVPVVRKWSTALLVTEISVMTTTVWLTAKCAVPLTVGRVACKVSVIIAIRRVGMVAVATRADPARDRDHDSPKVCHRTRTRITRRSL